MPGLSQKEALRRKYLRFGGEVVQRKLQKHRRRIRLPRGQPITKATVQQRKREISIVNSSKKLKYLGRKLEGETWVQLLQGSWPYTTAQSGTDLRWVCGVDKRMCANHQPIASRLGTPLPPSGTESTLYNGSLSPAGQNGPLRDLQLRNKQQRLTFFCTFVFCFHAAKRRPRSCRGTASPAAFSEALTTPGQPRVSVRRPPSPSPQENTVYCGQSCSSIWGHHLSLMGIFP